MQGDSERAELELEGSSLGSLTCAAPGGLVAAVDAQVATLARGDHVGAYGARRVAFAKVGGGENHAAFEKARGLGVEFGAASDRRVGLVDAALAGAFAAASGADGFNLVGEGFPSRGVACSIEGHQVSLLPAGERIARVLGLVSRDAIV